MKLTVSAALAAALALSGAALAQDKQDGHGGPGGPAPGAQGGQQGDNARSNDGKGGGAPARSERSGPQGAPSKGQRQAQPEPKAQPSEQKGRAERAAPERRAEPKEKSPAQQRKAEPSQKQPAQQRQAEPQNKATPRDNKGRAEQQQPNRNERQAQPQTPAQQQPHTGAPPAKSAGPAPKADERTAPAQKSAQPNDANRDRAGARVTLSDDQRGRVRQTIVQDRQINRVRNANIRIDIGVRVPRTVRLAPLPAAVVTLVPEYRAYRYFVANDEICIVDPRTYDIVEIIPVSEQTAQRPRSGPATVGLTLTPAEQALVLAEIPLVGDSTLGLGALTEGAEVPRTVELRPFPERVVHRIGKLSRYRYFTAENRIAIVSMETPARVVMVLEPR